MYQSECWRQSVTNKETNASLEVYRDFSEIESIILIEGRLPKHENEIAVTSQLRSSLHVHTGDTIRAEYSKVRRDYVITGAVNSVVAANSAYMTEAGFRKLNPVYSPVDWKYHQQFL